MLSGFTFSCCTLNSGRFDNFLLSFFIPVADTKMSRMIYYHFKESKEDIDLRLLTVRFSNSYEKFISVKLV